MSGNELNSWFESYEEFESFPYTGFEGLAQAASSFVRGKLGESSIGPAQIIGSNSIYKIWCLMRTATSTLQKTIVRCRGSTPVVGPLGSGQRRGDCPYKYCTRMMFCRAISISRSL